MAWWTLPLLLVVAGLGFAWYDHRTNSCPVAGGYVGALILVFTMLLAVAWLSAGLILLTANALWSGYAG